ncbi:MAG: NAD(P)-dependent oxidoreductase [Gemmatimonadetes bacterium]|nr:NAD(P)-dependent oxidoreductase [Gemmatimonadota bacterium]
MTHIAYLGTGLLGSAFVEAALGRGDAVTVWNRTRAKAEPLAAKGATVAATPADAVRGAARVHLVLTDDAVVNDVIAQCAGALAADAIIVDHSTTQPVLTAERAARLAKAGVRYLHAPVFIGPAMARQALGSILVAGPEALFEQVKPALEQQAAKVVYFGERADLAAVFKLCGNGLLIGVAGAVADMYAIAKGAGVPSAEASKIFEFFNFNVVVGGRGGAMAAGKFTPPSFELTMARKDVRLMLETAGAAPMSTLPGIAARMDALIAAGHGADELAVIARDSVA